MKRIRCEEITRLFYKGNRREPVVLHVRWSGGSLGLVASLQVQDGHWHCGHDGLHFLLLLQLELAECLVGNLEVIQHNELIRSQ